MTSCTSSAGPSSSTSAWPSTGASAPTRLVGLGVFFLVSGLLSVLSPDLVGLYDAPTSGLDQLAHLLLGLAAVVIGWMGRGVERREVGRSASRPLRS